MKGWTWGVYGNPLPEITFPHVGTEWERVRCLPLLCTCQDRLLYLLLRMNAAHFLAGAYYCVWPGGQRLVSLCSNKNETDLGRIWGRLGSDNSAGKLPLEA